MVLLAAVVANKVSKASKDNKADSKASKVVKVASVAAVNNKALAVSAAERWLRWRLSRESVALAEACQAPSCPEPIR